MQNMYYINYYVNTALSSKFNMYFYKHRSILSRAKLVLHNELSVAIRALHKHTIVVKTYLSSVAQTLEHQTGNMATLVRVQVEQTRFYYYNGDLAAYNDIVSLHAFLDALHPS